MKGEGLLTLCTGCDVISAHRICVVRCVCSAPSVVSRLLVHRLRKGIVYLLVPTSAGQLTVEDLQQLAELQGEVKLIGNFLRADQAIPTDPSLTLLKPPAAAPLSASPRRFFKSLSLYELLNFCRHQQPFAAQDVCIHLVDRVLRIRFEVVGYRCSDVL